MAEIAIRESEEVATDQIMSVVMHVDLDTIQAPKTYEGCRDAIKEVLRSAEMTGVLSCWIVGRLVSEASKSAKYGEGVVNRLAEDMSRSNSILYDFKRFYDEYPSHALMNTMDGIAWSNVRQLIAIPDTDTRDPLIARCKEKPMTVNELKELIDMTLNTADATADVVEEEEAPEPEPEDGLTSAAIQYFSKLDAVLETFQEDITELLSKLPEMKVLTVEEELTTEEDYDAILEKGLDISVKARALGEFINLNLYELNSADAFHAPTKE